MNEQLQQVDASTVDAEEFARNIGQMPDRELRAAMEGPLREQIVAEVFRRMELHYRPQNGEDAVIHWRIGGRPAGGEDHWEVVISGERCTTSSEPRSEPRATLKLEGVHFLKLVTGNANGPRLFMTRKLKIDGDLMFSARIPAMFSIPST